MGPSNLAAVSSSTAAETEQLVELFAAMNTATQAADERMASESNKTFAKFFEMMEAMQASMKGTAAEMHSLRERLEATEQRNKELEILRQAEKQAAEDRAAALEAKVNSLSRDLRQAKAAHEAIKVRLETHTHPYVNTVTNCNGGMRETPSTTAAPNPPPPPPPRQSLSEGCTHQ